MAILTGAGMNRQYPMECTLRPYNYIILFNNYITKYLPGHRNLHMFKILIYARQIQGIYKGNGL